MGSDKYSWFRNDFFTAKQAVFISLLFVFGIIAANKLIWWVAPTWFEYTPTRYWPVNVFGFRPHPQWGEFLFFIGQGLGFIFGFRLLRKKDYPISGVLVLAFVLIFCANLTHGWEEGFERPHYGKLQYYSDIPKVESPAKFLEKFNEIQPDLSMHGKTHPPGAVLTVYAFDKVSPGKGWLSVWILLFSVSGSVLFFYGFLKRYFAHYWSSSMTFLLMMIPGILIYYCASLDALIAMYGIAFLYFLSVPHDRYAVPGLMSSIFLFSFSTFAFLFLMPVFLAYEWFVRKTLRRFLMVLGGGMVLYGLLFMVTAYNPVEAFLFAAKVENPDGFILFADPVHYVLSRIQGVLELVFFVGPFLIVLLARGIPSLRKDRMPLFVLFLAGTLTFSAMLLSGAFRVGETGRVAMFLYPFLLLPVLVYLEDHPADIRSMGILAGLVYFHGLILQFIGVYFW